MRKHRKAILRWGLHKFSRRYAGGITIRQFVLLRNEEVW